MAETAQTPSQPADSAAPKHPNISFSIWPPSERTRDAVRSRLIETLSSPSILSKRYGTISREEAVDVAKRIEEEAFETAGKAADADDDGIEILQVYSKEISKRMLDTVKARSAESGALETPQGSDATVKVSTATQEEEEDGDTGSSAPPQSEKTESVTGDE